MALVDKLDARLTALDAEIARIEQNAVDEVARITTQKQTLQQARLFLLAKPEAEALLTDLKALGVL